jgi:uncharacterized membrane protein YoaK (UPF0700 family)
MTLLTCGTGAMDAIAFLALGGAFVSVMTGNLVLLGLGVTKRALALRCAVAIVSYIVGAAVGARVARRGDDELEIPRSVAAVVWMEFGLIAAFTLLWQIGDGKPSAGWQYPLIILAAIAMGMRSAAIRRISTGGLSTTYLTGMFTAMIEDAVNAGPTARLHRGLPIIAGVVFGAGVSGLLVEHAPRAAPLWPLAILVVVLIFGREARET